MTPSLLDQAVFNIRMTALYYVAIAGLFFALWLWWRWRPGTRSALQPRPVGAPQIRRELLMSLFSVIVIGAFTPVVLALGLQHHTRFYRDIAQHGWPYFFASILLMALVQDTWFYWSHRAMHGRWLFRWLHRTHHRSVHTNPWTTYSINPLGRWINTSTAHNTHHARGRYNYGWYFLFWDRIMGTLAPDYDEHYRHAGFSAPGYIAASGAKETP